MPIYTTPKSHSTVYSSQYFPHTYCTHTVTPTLHFSPLYCPYTQHHSHTVLYTVPSISPTHTVLTLSPQHFTSHHSTAHINFSHNVSFLPPSLHFTAFHFTTPFPTLHFTSLMRVMCATPSFQQSPSLLHDVRSTVITDIYIYTQSSSGQGGKQTKSLCLVVSSFTSR